MKAEEAYSIKVASDIYVAELLALFAISTLLPSSGKINLAAAHGFFPSLCVGDWGGKDFKDILGYMDEAVARHKVAENFAICA